MKNKASGIALLVIGICLTVVFNLNDNLLGRIAGMIFIVIAVAKIFGIRKGE